MRVLIADDHPLYLSAACEHLGRLFPGVEIDVAGTLDGVLDALGDRVCRDMVLMDYSMPGMTGPGTVGQVVVAANGAPVAVMSGVAPVEDVAQCIGAGAKGFLPKTLDGKVFGSALNLILSGGSYLPAELFAGHLGAPITVPPTASAAPSANEFSPRDRDIMRMLVDGKSNKEIARSLNLREVTIKVQLTHIYRKLGAKNRAQAAMLMSTGAMALPQTAPH